MSTVVFFVSLIGIIALFVFRGWETEKNKILASDLRAKLDKRVFRHVEDVKLHAPRIGRNIVSLSAYHAKDLTNKARMGLVDFIEQKLISIVDRIRGKKVVTRESPPSSFLKIVSEHKRESSRDKQ